MLFTANDAYMREFAVYAPSDCIASNTAADNEYALRQIALVLKGDVTPSVRLTFRPARSANGAGRPSKRSRVRAGVT